MDLQRIDVEKSQLVCEEGLQALCALSAGRLGLQHIDDEIRPLVCEEGLQALHALSAGCLGLQPIDMEKAFRHSVP